ncbi:translation initiation factor eIF-2B subunit gamma isoform X1 [Octopus sinensis]|uniref:Translation initiation factor eIF2B subunit gamma n=1 Tax=Octopus sinensis TaxID=2607531 RepID=A0A6P7TJH2_9MOLL|nr:translation initiation factor eIF-2B subunit gamma isoform X1 [Octopus sinensis]
MAERKYVDEHEQLKRRPLHDCSSPEALRIMDYHPVILAAGTGSRMNDLTANTPKALLTVGNKPMIWYSINMCQKAGFQEAMVLVQESKRSEIKRKLEFYEFIIKLDFVNVPDDSSGTADALRLIRNKVKYDLLIISSDLITTLPLHYFTNHFKAYDASFLMLLSPLPESFNEAPVPGVKVDKQNEGDVIGLDKELQRLVFHSNEADQGDFITFSHSFLTQCPFISLRTDMTDCHLYIMKKWIFEFLLDRPKITTLKGELVPYIVKKQFSKNKSKKDDTSEGLSKKRDIYSYIPKSFLAEAYQLTLSNKVSPTYHEEIHCYVYIQEKGFCVRTNTLANYAEANRQILKHFPELMPPGTLSKITAGKSSKIDDESLLDGSVSLGKNVSITHSVIGAYCKIYDKVKITNSVVLDHTEIGEGSIIDGCIICDSVYIGENCDLKDSIVGSQEKIEANTKLTHESVDTQMMKEKANWFY